MSKERGRIERWTERDRSDLNRSDSALSEERERGKRDKVDATSNNKYKGGMTDERGRSVIVGGYFRGGFGLSASVCCCS